MPSRPVVRSSKKKRTRHNSKPRSRTKPRSKPQKKTKNSVSKKGSKRRTRRSSSPKYGFLLGIVQDALRHTETGAWFDRNTYKRFVQNYPELINGKRKRDEFGTYLDPIRTLFQPERVDDLELAQEDPKTVLIYPGPYGHAQQPQKTIVPHPEDYAKSKYKENQQAKKNNTSDEEKKKLHINTMAYYQEMKTVFEGNLTKLTREPNEYQQKYFSIWLETYMNLFKNDFPI